MESGKKWYAKSFRRNLVDMHIDGWDTEFLSRFDEREYFDCLRRAHIQSSMIYTHSHVGWCNWDSQSGGTHPAFGGDNKIRRLFDLCHGAGMDVVAYYSLIYNNWAHERHPEWRMVNARGEHSRADGSRYGLVCPNNPGYRDFLKAQFAELCAAYEFEGVFLDMTFWPMVCCCDSCRERYHREEERELPAAVDWHDPAWLSFQRARTRWMGEFARFCTEEIKGIKPDVTVEHQFSTMASSWPFAVDGGVNEASNYSGGDLYGGFLQQSYVSKMYYEITRNQPFEYMTSRCDPDLADHTTTKDGDSLRQHNYLTLAHHGAFLAIDAIDPRGTLNGGFYDLLGKVFEESMPYEQYLTGRLQADVAIIMAFESKCNLHEPPHGAETVDWSQLQQGANIGAAAALLGRHSLWTALPSNRLDKLEGKRVAVLTEAPFLTDDEIDRITRYVRAGGALYASGSTSPALMERLLGMKSRGFTAEEITYVAPTDKGRELFGPFSADYPLAFKGPQALMDVPAEHRVLATITLPYTHPKDAQRFAAIHSNPPGRRTNLPSLVLGQCGRGRVLWSAAGFERNPQRAHKEVFANLIDLLHGGPHSLQTDAPAFVEFLLFDDEEKGRMLLSAVNLQEHPPVLRPGDMHVTLRTDRPIRAVSLLPNREPIPFEQREGTVSFEMKGMHLFQMVMLEYQAGESS